MKDFGSRYTDQYFENRLQNDEIRISCFKQEKYFIQKQLATISGLPLTDDIELNGIVCDVGCSTGEFLQAVNWSGQKFGMEINANAKLIAQKSGINFEKNILNQTGFFDVVIFRGTIQHLPEPFHYISQAWKALKDGGVIIFLATPNANSIVYKIFNTLPALCPELNFYIPSDISLTNILKNFDFKLLKIDYPYMNSPYANFVPDHINFVKSVILRREPKFPFWKNMMNLIAQKQ